MSRLIYVDSFSVGTFHEMFNASSLVMFAEIFDDVNYYTSKDVKNNTFKIIGSIPPNIRYRNLPILAGRSKIGAFIRQFIPIVTNCYILLKSNRNDVIFFNFNALWSLPIINILTKLLKRKVIIMSHGEIEYLINGTKLNSFSNFVLSSFNSGRFKPAKTLYFSVLGDSIKNNIIKNLPSNIYSKIISFNHSYIFRNNIQQSKKEDSKIRIGTVGSVRKGKWIDNLLELGSKLKTLPEVEFYALGRVFFNKDILDEYGINIVPESNIRFLSRHELDDEISKLDFIVFLYPGNSYRYTASGALYDAIDSEKQILALKNDYFNDVFSRNNDIGTLFDDINQLFEYLLNQRNHKIINTLDYVSIKKRLGVLGVKDNCIKELEKIDFI